MNDRKEFSLLRAGTIMGVGLGLGIGFGLMMIEEAIVLPRWLAGIHASFEIASVLPLICFLGGLLLAKKARAIE